MQSLKGFEALLESESSYLQERRGRYKPNVSVQMGCLLTSLEFYMHVTTSERYSLNVDLHVDVAMSLISDPD